MQVTGKHLELTQEVLDYLERKLGKLNRHLNNLLESKVEITKEMTKSAKDRYVVQVTLNSNGTLLRGEVRAAELLEAIDKVAEIMDRQIERFKGRHQDKNRGVSPNRQPAGAPASDTGKMVKSKKFPVKPMSMEDAIEQMELLGHDFFLYFDSSKGKFNVVYRRMDGNYGLIDPELGGAPGPTPKS